MSDPYIGEIQIYGFTFNPRGWAFCNGATQSIAQNSALFSLLGTTYGGDGMTTFGLPNLQGRTPIGISQGPGLSNRTLGEMAGTESVTLTATQMPGHTHALQAYLGSQNRSATPTGGVMLSSPAATRAFVPNTAGNTTLHPSALTPVGGGQPHENRQPYLVLNYCIALEGIFPSTN